MLRHTDTEGGKVPKGLDAFGYNVIGYLLSFINRNRDNPDSGSVPLLHGAELAHVLNRNSVYRSSGKFFADIETGYDLESVLTKSGILQQGSPQTTHPEQEGFMT